MIMFVILVGFGVSMLVSIMRDRRMSLKEKEDALRSAMLKDRASRDLIWNEYFENNIVGDAENEVIEN